MTYVVNEGERIFPELQSSPVHQSLYTGSVHQSLEKISQYKYRQVEALWEQFKHGQNQPVKYQLNSIRTQSPNTSRIESTQLFENTIYFIQNTIWIDSCSAPKRSEIWWFENVTVSRTRINYIHVLHQCSPEITATTSGKRNNQFSYPKRHFSMIGELNGHQGWIPRGL